MSGRLTKKPSLGLPDTLFVTYGLLFGVTAPACAEEVNSALFHLSLEQLLRVEIASASKTSDPVRDIPASVTLLTRDDIALMGYTTLEELLISVPGFYHLDTYEDFSLGVRGTAGGSIAFLVNGVPQHPTRIKSLTVPDRSRSNIPIESIDRIEIIRGPSSVIYGNNAFLGSLNVVTNEVEKSEVTMSVSLGENGTRKGFLRLSEDLENGYSVLNLGVYRHNGLGGELGDMLSDEQYNDVVISDGMYTDLDGTLAKDYVSAEFTGMYKQVNYGFRYSNMDYGFYALYPGYDEGNQLALDSWHVNVGYEQNVNSELIARVNLILSNENYYLDADFLYPDIRGYQQQGSNRTEVEVLLSNNTSERFAWVLGVNGRQLKSVENNADFFELNVLQIYESDAVDSAAAFMNVNFDVTEWVSLIAGYRYTNTSEYGIDVILPDPEGNKIYDRQMLKARSDDAVKLAAIFEVTDLDLLKVIYSNATQDNSSINLLEPETISSYELNYLRSGQKNSISFSIFENDVQKIRRRTILVTDTGIDEILDNSSHWLIRGAELILTHRPGSNMIAELSGVYQNSEDKFLGGAAVAYSPQSQIKAKMGYGYKQWSMSGSVIYVGSMDAHYDLIYDDASNDPTLTYLGSTVGAYTLLNGNLRYQSANASWYANIHAFNLGGTEIRYPANELAAFEYGAIGPGRQLVFSFGYHY